MVTLKEYLNSDRIDYFPFGSKGYIMDWLLRTEQYWIRRYIRALRKEEFYMNYKRNKILQYYFSRKKNLLGIRLGFFINAGCFDIGLKIYHYGSIIVNPKSRIGKNCTIPDDSPVIGNNVDIGQNAQILGGIYIADGVKIGAGAVVTKSVLVPGVTVVGVPARIVEK